MKEFCNKKLVGRLRQDLTFYFLSPLIFPSWATFCQIWQIFGYYHRMYHMFSKAGSEIEKNIVEKLITIQSHSKSLPYQSVFM